MYRIISLALILAVAYSVPAQAKPGKEAVQLGGTAPVADQIRAVEMAMASEDYSELTMQDRSAVQQSLNKIRLQMGDHERIDQVSPQAKVDIFNEQERVNTILTHGREESRLVCRREKTVGSNFPKNVCMTVAQRRAAEEAARTNLRDANRSQLKPLN